MKTIISKYWLVLMVLVSMTLLSACSSDDDATSNPVFPQVQTIAGNAGDEFDFTFEANENWSLASSAIWCKMVQGEDGKEAFVLNGTAGKQTIKVKLTDDDASKNKTVAQLFLNMGGQKVAIAEIIRSADGYELEVCDENGNPIDEIVVGYKDVIGQPAYNKFIVKANYRFAVTNTPAWVDLEGGFLVGKPNVDAKGGVAFKENQGLSAKYAVSKEDKYAITFSSEDGKAEKTIPVVFKGMPEEAIDIVRPASSSIWAVWSVSTDGKTFTQNSSSLTGETTSSTTYHNFVPFKISALNDAYQLVAFEKKKGYLYEDGSQVVQLTGENGNAKLTVKPLSSGSREFTVYVLPKSVYENLENGLDGMLDEEFTSVKSEYDNYFLMNIEQKEAKKDDADVVLPIVTSMGMQVDCAKSDNADYKAFLRDNFGYTGDDIFEANVYGGFVAVYPQLEDWNPMAGDGVIFADGSSNIIENYSLEQDETGIYAGVYTDALTFPIIAVFQDMTGKVKRVVIINNMGFRSKKNRK